MKRRAAVPVRQRRVSAELRELRKRAGLTCADVAKALGTSITKISRMETGDRGLYLNDVAAMLGLYRVPNPRREQLLELVRDGHEPNWWQMQYSRLPTVWQDVIQLEADAAAIVNFETMVVPGLLQTSEYTNAVLRSMNEELSESETDRLVAARMARQALLSRRNAPTFHAVLDEAVLRRPVGEPGVMQRQLQHLLTCAQRPNITLQVLPFTAGATPGLGGPTVLFELPDGIEVIYLETRAAGVFLSEEPPVRRAKLALRRLGAMALAPEESVALIATLTGENI